MTEPIQYVNNKESLVDAVDQLNRAASISIDLEFDKNFYRYGFNLCLIQIFDGATCYLFDPINDDVDIEQLFPLLESDQTQKVCFSFDEDLRLLHSIGCFPTNLFDISLASRLLNDPPLSLTNILQEHLDIDTGSSSQQSNWFKRPLTQKQILYAANDVIHLFKLRDFIINRGEELGLSEWIKQENKLLDELDYSDVDHNDYIKEKEKNGLTEVQWHIYKQLLEWQNGMGKKYNRPAYQIIPKTYLVELSKDTRQLMNWNKTNGIFRKLKSDTYKQELLDLIKKAIDEASELKLSDKKPARRELTQTEHSEQLLERREIDRAKSELFKPIKEHIEQKYGNETSNFLLSNRLISDIVTGSNGKLPDYRKELFFNTAKDLSLDIEKLQGYLSR